MTSMRLAWAGRSRAATSASRSRAGASGKGIRQSTPPAARRYARPVEVRVMRPGEGARLSELRLRALRDAPLAFSSRPEVEERFPPEEWEKRGRTVVIAEDGG